MINTQPLREAVNLLGLAREQVSLAGLSPKNEAILLGQLLIFTQKIRTLHDDIYNEQERSAEEQTELDSMREESRHELTQADEAL